MMKLSQVRKGNAAKITHIPDANVRSQAIRLGIGEGSLVICQDIIPAGPVVIKKNRQEIAVGRGLANSISVEEIRP
jgi:Fe2+ transport system protein FeoA